MKHLILPICILFIHVAKGQDKIIKHTGDTIDCKVTEVLENGVKYCYKDETVVNTVSKNMVSQIIFSSGRVQKVTDKIIVTNEGDWQKVIITNLESDITGLKKVGEIQSKANSGWSTTSVGKMQAKALEKLKKEAAKQGAFIVLILTETSQAGHYGVSGGTKASFIGTIYSYN
jgi:hypothetical protein